MTSHAADTIFALSSGNPPAAIGVMRISGPRAGETLERLSGRMPEARRASVAALKHPVSGELLDRALMLWFQGPNSSTGEDLAELHLHGGRSVVAAVAEALEGIEGLRPAEPGEFTRRAFENGRIDLAEAEGLADLLMAETQSQRRAALALAGGELSRTIEGWQQRLLALSAELEASLDFADEGDVEEEVSAEWKLSLSALSREMETMLARPPVERLREGVRVVIAGPPNAGKSSLLNCLIGRQAAITSEIPGTTRDIIEAPAAIGGTPFLLVDTAGLRSSADEIEAIGVDLAKDSLATADFILWLGDPADAPDRERTLVVRSKADLGSVGAEADVAVSAVTREGIDDLIGLLRSKSKELLPQEGEVAVNRRHKAALAECVDQLREAGEARDPLIASEQLRQARVALDRITGRAGVEEMLGALFGAFCIGK